MLYGSPMDVGMMVSYFQRSPNEDVLPAPLAVIEKHTRDVTEIRIV